MVGSEIKSKPFAPLLGQFLLEKDVENEGVGHQSSEQEEYASCEKQYSNTSQIAS